MGSINAAKEALCDVMRSEVCAGDKFRDALDELIKRHCELHDRRMRDIEADRLLPLGADVVRIRQGCCRATAYNRAKRARLSKQVEAG